MWQRWKLPHIRNLQLPGCYPTHQYPPRSRGAIESPFRGLTCQQRPLLSNSLRTTRSNRITLTLSSPPDPSLPALCRRPPDPLPPVGAPPAAVGSVAGAARQAGAAARHPFAGGLVTPLVHRRVGLFSANDQDQDQLPKLCQNLYIYIIYLLCSETVKEGQKVYSAS